MDIDDGNRGDEGILRSITLMVPKALQGLMGISTTMIMAKAVSPEIQGIFFTMASLQGLFALFDLGITFTFIQFSRHEFISLKVDDRGYISGSQQSVSNFINIVKGASLWFRKISFRHAMVLGVIGSIFLLTNKKIVAFDILLWWWASVISVSMMITMQHVQVFMFAVGKAKKMNLLDLYGSMFAFIITMLFIHNNLILGILCLQPLMNFVFRGCYLKFFLPGWANLLEQYKHAYVSEQLQSKIREVRLGTAGTWICGFLAFNLATPAIFYLAGGSEAGRFGITTAIFNGIYMLVTTIFFTKNPHWVELASLNRTDQLKASLHSTLWITSAISLFLFTIYFIALLLLDFWRLLPINKFIDTYQALLLSLHYLVQIWISGIYVYIRSYRVDNTFKSLILTSSIFFIGVPSVIRLSGFEYLPIFLVTISFVLQLPMCIFLMQDVEKGRSILT